MIYKLTWMANKQWILNAYTLNGNKYIGLAYPQGIPMFNPSNHNFN
jgi:hypothetical protein